MLASIVGIDLQPFRSGCGPRSLPPALTTTMLGEDRSSFQRHPCPNDGLAYVRTSPKEGAAVPLDLGGDQRDPR